MRIELSGEVTDLVYREIEVEIEPYLEDIGIGHWECHGSGYHSDIVAVWDNPIEAVYMDHYAKADKSYEFDYDKLNKRNQNWIDKALEKALQDITVYDVESYLKGE